MAYIGNTQLNQNYVPAIDYFSGNGSTTAFTLSRPVASVAQVQAVIENVPQNPGDAYTVSGNTITFTSAPPSGTNNIYVYYTSPNTQVVQPGQGTVGTTQMADGVTVNFNDGSAAAPSITNTGDTNTGMFFPAADTIAFSEGGVETMRLDSSGNVGIGTSSPTYKLQMSGGNVAFSNTAGNVCNVEIAGNGNTPGTNSFVIQQATTSDTLLWNRANANLTFGTNATERMRIDSSGNVGIGTTNTSYKLNVYAAGATSYDAINITSSGSGNLFIGNNSATSGAIFSQGGGASLEVGGQSFVKFTTGNIAGSATERMRIDSSGSVIVGATTTGAYFDGNLNVFKSGNIPLCVKIDTVSAWDISCWSTPTSGNNAFLNFGTEGTFTSRGSITYNRAGGLTAYNTTSDQRLKENITDSLSALSKIDSVKVRSFDWKETGNHVDFGVIAQELNEVAPECVTPGKDNEDGSIKNPWAVDTSALVPAMIKAIQELKAIVDEQAEKIKALEAK